MIPQSGGKVANGWFQLFQTDNEDFSNKKLMQTYVNNFRQMIKDGQGATLCWTPITEAFVSRGEKRHSEVYMKFYRKLVKRYFWTGIMWWDWLEPARIQAATFCINWVSIWQYFEGGKVKLQTQQAEGCLKKKEKKSEATVTYIYIFFR